MKPTPTPRHSPHAADANRLADFVLMTQRSCILNLSAKLAEDKVSYSQFFLLTYLASEEFLSMSDIAKKMGHSTAAATGLVDRLEKLGFVERIHAAEDRRKILTQITTKGTKLVATMRQEIAKDLSQLMLSWDQDEKDAYQHTRRALSQKPTQLP